MLGFLSKKKGKKKNSIRPHNDTIVNNNSEIKSLVGQRRGSSGQFSDSYTFPNNPIINIKEASENIETESNLLPVNYIPRTSLSEIEENNPSESKPEGENLESTTLIDRIYRKRQLVENKEEKK